MSDGFSPPEGVRAAARRGLELRRKFGRGGTLVGVARARDLSNGKSISASTIKRMVSFFARHAVDKRPNWSDPSKPTNGYIAHMLWGGDAGRSWANKVSRSIDAKKSVTEKHLPGKHNQRTHGRRGYGSSRGGDGLSAEAFVAESTRLGDQTQRELDGIAQATPRQWSFEDENAFIDGVTADKPADYLDQQTVRESISRWSIRARQEGLTPEQALRAWNIAISQQGNTDTPSELTDMTVLLTTIKIQDLHHERAVAVSRMSYAEQDAAYDLVRARIDSKREARDALRKSGVDVFDMPYDPELVSDCEAIMALALYGNPDLRLRAVAYGTNGTYYPFGEGGMPITVRREKVNSAGQRIPVDIARHESTISGGIQYYSLDYRLHVTSFDTNQYGERTAVSEKRHQEEFIQTFTKTHTTQNTSNVLGAAIQSAMSQVGPNRESSAQSLYPKGIKPPEPHPKIVKFLQQRYEQTQREYAQSGVTEVQLYRGTKRGPINGIPMSPWSDSQSVSQNFTGGDYLAGIPGYKPTLNRAPNMPVRYVFMHYGQSDFKTAFTENEFLILETTAVRRGRVIRQGNIGFVDDVTWSIKQLQALNPYDQADGIVDYSLVSLYEPQYDIFYNYREKPSKPKVKKKHLPGGHDQRNHGRRGPDKGGRGGGGGGMTASEYVRYADKVDAELQASLDDLASRAPITWSQEDTDRVTSHYMGLLNKYNQTALPQWKYTEQEIMPDLQKAIERAQQSGFTPDEIMAAMNNRFDPRSVATMYNIIQVSTEVLKQAHRKRAIAISHMSDKEQDAVYDVYIARAKPLAELHRHAQNMTEEQRLQMISSAEQLFALSLYGNPDVRMRAVTFINEEFPSHDIKRIVTLKSPNVAKYSGNAVSDQIYLGDSIIRQTEYYSLEHRLYKTPNAPPDAQRNAFISAFTYTHTSQNTENVLGAAIQTAMSQVGPNADAPPARSFYPSEIKPPRPHPTVVRLLNEQYQETQREFAEQGITTVKLYRGVADDFTMGIPMSPWSARKSVSQKFGTILNTATMPVKYVFMYDGQPIFQTRYVEREHLVFETAALANAKSKRTGNNVSWTSIKNLTDADGKTMPPENSYEPQYDIFYNYQKRAKKSVTQKHLPGKHDQRTHGRRGRAGSAFASTYVSARQDGKTHQQALNEAKTAAEQVRQQMREEKRYWEGRLQQDDVSASASARVPIDQASNIRNYSPEEIADYISRRFDEIGPRALARLTPEERRAEQDAKDAYTAWSDYASSIEKQGRAPTPREQLAINELYRVQRLAAQRAQAVRERIQQYETDESYAAHMEVLTKMRHPTDPWTSATKNMPHNPKLQPAGQDNRQEVASLIDATFAMFPQPRELDLVTGTRTVNSQYQYLIEPTARRAGFTYGSGKGGSMTYPYERSEYQFSTTVHEALHAVQYSRSHSNPLNYDLGNWAVGRVGNEKVKSMNRIHKGRSYKPWELGYTDKVDDPYTLKRRVVSGLWVQGVRGDRVLDTSWRAQGFMEVLPQAFTDLRRASQRKDKELLVVAIQAVLNTTDEGG